MITDRVMGFVEADFKIALPVSISLETEIEMTSIYYSPDIISVKRVRTPFNGSDDNFAVAIRCCVFNTNEHPKSEIFIHFENREITIRINIDHDSFESFFGKHTDRILTLKTRYYIDKCYDSFIYVKPHSLTIRASN